MATFQGKRVSRRWKAVLEAAVRDGVKFTLTSGRRTMSEQAALFRLNMVRPGVPKPGRPLTAFPNPLAPHIRVGSQAHALDINSLDGGETRFERWVEKHGVDWRNTVPGEAWHGELTGRALRKLHRRTRDIPVRELSDEGEDFLIREEGVRRYAYNDPAGHATFGVGHLIHKGPVTLADKRHWGTRENPKPMSFVKEILRNDLKDFEKAVRDAVKVPLKQHEFDALISLAFNIGIGGFKSSEVVKHLNAGRRRKAGRAFLNWRRAGNDPDLLLPRRKRERRLFRRGKYT